MQIFDSQYFGNFNYYISLLKHSNNKINLYQNWYKMSFLNRCVIVGSNGLINLTVPVVGGRNQKLVFGEVEINYNQDWQRQHYHAILSCYSKSPFFEYYSEWMSDFYNMQFKYLCEMNDCILQKICSVYKINTPENLAEPLNFSGSNLSVQDRSKMWLPNNYEQVGQIIKYPQVFEDRIGFKPNLSILDVLFCIGPTAKQYFVQED